MHALELEVKHDSVAASDADLLLKVAKRGESPRALEEASAAFRELYGKYSRILTVFLASRVPWDDVEDTHQEVWQRVWQGLPDSARDRPFRGYLLKTARNLVIDRARKKHSAPLPEAELADASADAAERETLERERSEILRRCLDKLETELARIVVARLRGDSYEMICTQTGLDAARAQKLFHQAKEKLNACVERAFQ
jgi:RNA polymerase sigma factor (sigma-70 family)